MQSNNQTKVLSSRSTKRIRTFVLSLFGAATLSLFTFGSAQASHTIQHVIDYKLHVLECSILLFTDPALHLETCGVGERTGGLSWGKTGQMKMMDECDHDYGDHEYSKTNTIYSEYEGCIID